MEQLYHALIKPTENLNLPKTSVGRRQDALRIVTEKACAIIEGRFQEFRATSDF